MADARPGRTRSEAAQRAILEATRDELARRGYDKLSIDRIATAAGVGKQTVYRWYPTKSALVAECVLLGYVFAPGIETPDSGSTRADIASWAKGFADNSIRPEAAALVRAATAASAEDADVAARYQEQVRASLAVLTDRLRRGMGTGEIKPETPVDTVAESVVGALLYRVLTRQPLTADFVRELIGTIFDGIEKTPQTRSTRGPRR
jgi:AcrR family transcriptional regulator